MQSKEKPDLIQEGIVRKPHVVNGTYSAYFLKYASGVLYITEDSPHYVSGHIRMLGKDRGRYPYRYREMREELFGSFSGKSIIEVCSGDVEPGFDIFTVDINPDKHPSMICDGQDLPDSLSNRFDIWSCDPPYNEDTAKMMYHTGFPEFSKLISSGSNVIRPGGLLFLLLGNKNMQWCPPVLTKIGQVFLTVIPSQEVRALHIYYKHK